MLCIYAHDMPYRISDLIQLISSSYQLHIEDLYIAPLEAPRHCLRDLLERL